MLNTILADSLHCFNTRLSMADDVELEIAAIVRDTMHDHGRIIFNGNNYSPEWIVEAERRGRENMSSSQAAFPAFTRKNNVELFERFHVFCEAECRARQEIMLENYNKVLSIEAATMITMVSRQLYPAAVRSVGAVASASRDVYKRQRARWARRSASAWWSRTPWPACRPGGPPGRSWSA